MVETLLEQKMYGWFLPSRISKPIDKKTIKKRGRPKKKLDYDNLSKLNKGLYKAVNTTKK